MKNIYQIFGSEKSVDYDVMVFVEKIPSTEESKKLCEKYNDELYNHFIDIGWDIKKVGCNIAVLSNGIITQVHKGTFDECNNSLYLTYHLHKQKYPNQIKRLVPRDIDMKIMRTARILLMSLSRTEYRTMVKNALHSNFIERLKVLEELNYTKIKDINKNIEWVDFIKTVSAQLGQTLSLLKGEELYTKEEIARDYPDLSGMLNRKSEDLSVLEKYKLQFITHCKKRIPHMKTYDEYKN